MARNVPKDQTFCPKCGRMYCEGFWGEGVCTADMFFGSEPTAAGDLAASYLRAWYEANRESWRDRFWKRWERSADEFMLGLMAEVDRIGEAAKREAEKRRSEGSTPRIDDGKIHR